MARTPSVFSIPAHRSFADSLATGLVRRFASDPLGLAKGRILLPTNRAVRALRDAFVRVSGGGLVLPRLVPIGDPELGERLGAALDPLETDLAPAMPPLERQLLLAGLLRGEGRTALEAMRHAAELARTLDTLEVEDVTPAMLRELKADGTELAVHWERMLDQLALLFDRWPRLLEEGGATSLARRRNALLRGLAARWRETPPVGFTIIAGVTTTAPAVAELLATVARLPEGEVILPALAGEKEMPEAEWRALIPEDGPPLATHPQYGLRLLLDRIRVARGEVRPWRASGRGAAPAVRGRAAINAMAAAAFTDKWAELEAPDRRLPGVRALEAANPAGEAMAIAIALRRHLEQPELTAALVTPDRRLARRVSAILRRWNIDADDSAGTPLERTPTGSLLLAILDMAESDVAPVPLLALLKHPLVGGMGDARGEWLRDVRRLDLALRGPRPEPGLAGIGRAVQNARGKTRENGAEALERLAPVIERLLDVIDLSTPSSMAASLRRAVELVAGEEGWRGSAGRQAAELIATLEDSAAAQALGLEDGEAAPILRDLLSSDTVRPPYGGHPRIAIYGLLEARLQQADLMILGGLNEGVWPPSPKPDPWLAPRLRQELGLPPLESRIGLSAHDFMSAIGAPQVLLTRARRDEKSPTVASRFWRRLEAMTGGLTRERQLEALVRRIDRTGTVAPMERPAPSPPAALRPRKIYVTDADRLKADPFAYYAKAMLRLRPLDPLEADNGPAWRGSAVHDVLEIWFKEDGCDPAALKGRVDALLDDDIVHPMLRALWRPRLTEATDWIAQEVSDDMAAGRRPYLSEIDGGTMLHGVELRGKADRIDRDASGALTILDYKTGRTPAKSAVDEGFALQLPLLAMIASGGGFAGGQAVSGLEYWVLGRTPSGPRTGELGYKRRASSQPLEELMPRMHAEFESLCKKYLTGDEPFTALLHPDYSPYGDYSQLMRRDEWYGRQ